ncbi:MAG TPA: hypothetical protein VHK88_03875 [Aquihabitans sp.]|jgi:hypothetical protein|nr:hypothetical protein [Aquihabitans sp.]
MNTTLRPTPVRPAGVRRTGARSALVLVLGLTLGAVGCSSDDGGDASAASASAGAEAGNTPAAGSASSGGSVPDVCDLVDAETVERLTGVPVQAGQAGVSLGSNSRCEFTTSTGDGADVAVQLGAEEPADASLPDSPLLTREGFEDSFGLASTPVDGSDDTFAIFDDTLSVRQVAVLRTGGGRYALVTVTGFDVTEDAVDGAAALVGEVADRA